jgi:hypothetical protein
MKRAILAAALLCAATPALAREGWGVGVMVGDPFGLTLKRYLGGANAWDLYMAFAYGPGFRFGGDWLWTVGRAEAHRKFDLDAYIGVGPFIGDLQGPCGPGFLTDRCNGDFYFGGRVPLGAEILLKEAPVSFGVEVGPGVGFAPGRAGLVFDFLLAVRYLF